MNKKYLTHKSRFIVLALLTVVGSTFLGTACSDQGKADLEKSTEKSQDEKITEKLALQLFGLMETQDHQQETEYLRKKAQFLTRPDAAEALKGLYNDSIGQEYGRLTRWKSVYLSGFIYNEDSVQFLLSVAIKREPVKVSNYSKMPTQQDKDIYEYQINGDEAIRLSAESALVRALERQVPTSRDAVKTLLQRADRNIAEYGALNLFKKGILDQEFKTILDDRGIHYNFRRMSREEVLEYIKARPEDLVRKSVEAPAGQPQLTPGAPLNHSTTTTITK